MSTVAPTDRPPVEGIRQASTEEHNVSSDLHAQFVRIRHNAAAAAAGLALSFAGVACAAAASEPQASASSQSQSSIAPATTARPLAVGATSRGFVARMRELETRGYVQVECLVKGALMFNARTQRTVTVLADGAVVSGGSPTERIHLAHE
jgi:hypothetical protein